jgi:DNA-binding HxlR family transcriptional regulator
MKRYKQLCGLALSLERIGDRWTLLIVRELLTGAKRFSEIRSMLPGLAPNLLAARLIEMQLNGIVEKAGDSDQPGKYRLTALGQDLEESILPLIRWGGIFIPREAQSKKTFESPHWLIVALKALLENKSYRQQVLGQLIVDGFPIFLKIGPKNRPVVVGSRVSGADFTLTLGYRTCMGLFSGAIQSWRNDQRIGFSGKPECLETLLG